MFESACLNWWYSSPDNIKILLEQDKFMLPLADWLALDKEAGINLKEANKTTKLLRIIWIQYHKYLTPSQSLLITLDG